MVLQEKLNIFSETPENEYTKTVSQEHRKKLAQFFTPYLVAKFMANWILANPDCKTILDPAMGLGIFFRAMLENTNKKLSFKGYDIDDKVVESAKNLFSDEENIEIVHKDYMFNDWNNCYDGIICNPPYLKFHDFTTKDEILAEFQSRLGLKLNGFTNLYTLFLLKSIHQLNKNGRCAYLIPSEFLNSDYGTLVKKHLIENKSLRYVIIFDFKENMFADALTTSSIFLFANDNEKKEVEFINLTSQTALEKLTEKITDYPNLEIEKAHKIAYSALNPDIKWRFYYQTQNKQNYKNLVPFSMYAKVVRGIATGDNDYFSFTIQKQIEFGIEDKYLLPCIAKSTDIIGSFFTENNFQELKQKNKKVLLFNGIDFKNDLSNEKLKSYIELGEKNGTSQRFLTSNRNPWYALENRMPSPIWVGVFNRTGLRFVRNEANIRNLTTFHCVYFNTMFMQETDLFFAYLLTDLAKEIFNDNKREYGNGLNKFEPNDLNSSKVVDFSILTSSQKAEILKLYYIYRENSILKNTTPNLLHEINQIFTGIYKKTS
jgi:adenine-specific DNA-methyltransferase